jgi:hypothetical protein
MKNIIVIFSRHIIHVEIHNITYTGISSLSPLGDNVWRVKIPKHSLLLRVLLISPPLSDFLTFSMPQHLKGRNVLLEIIKMYCDRI